MPNIPLGISQQFTATGTFSDGSVQDVTGVVTWKSSSTGVASITVSGLATGLNIGATTISATMGTVSGNAALTVNAANLASITITPANGSIAQGTTTQLNATGTFNNGGTRNLTSQVTWSSSDTTVATVAGQWHCDGAAAGEFGDNDRYGDTGNGNGDDESHRDQRDDLFYFGCAFGGDDSDWSAEGVHRDRTVFGCDHAGHHDQQSLDIEQPGGGNGGQRRGRGGLGYGSSGGDSEHQRQPWRGKRVCDLDGEFGDAGIAAGDASERDSVAWRQRQLRGDGNF